MGADRKANTRQRIQVVAHSSFSIFVSLRMAASAIAPSAPILLIARLRARGRNGARVGV